MDIFLQTLFIMSELVKYEYKNELVEEKLATTNKS